jgi:hypothetical protein
VNHPDDIGRCTRCGRWQRRRHAYAEDFGPDDREEWCVTGGCFATWRDGVTRMASAQHDGADTCLCATCREARDGTSAQTIVEWAADHGHAGELSELSQGVG